MMDFLISIPGPLFLIVYIAFVATLLFFAKILMKQDYTEELTIPEPTKFEPIEIAILKEGVKGAIVHSVFNLWRMKAIEISTEKSQTYLQSKRMNTKGFNKLEKIIYEYCDTPKKYYILLNLKSIRTAKNAIDSYQDKLKQYKLIPDDEMRTRQWYIFWITLALIFGVGLTKLYFGVHYGKPSGFLFVLVVLSAIAIYKLLLPDKIIQTKLGKHFLASSEKRFEWVKTEDSSKVNFNNPDVIYGIALFGLAAFAGTSLASSLEAPILIASQTASSSSFWDISSGSSNGGSSCSGSSCSGGGCGGGGCGGCGGS